MKTLLSVFIACALFSIAFAQLSLPKNGCKDFCRSNSTAKQGLAPGLWYLTHAVPFGFSIAARCSYLNISQGKDNIIPFQNHETTQDGEYRLTNGTITINNDGTVSADYSSLDLPLRPQLFYISDDVFMLVYCLECGLYSKDGAGVYAYLYSKILYTPCGTIDATLNLASACGIKLSDLKPVDHSNCAKTC